MDFIMPVWVNANAMWHWLLLLSCLVFSPVSAGEFSTQLKNGGLEAREGWYVLNMDADYHFSPAAKQAIQSSIPLYWNLKIQLKKERYLQDKTVLSVTYRYRIRYHALLNSYSVKNETTNSIKKYASLMAALDSLSRLRELQIVAVSALDKNKRYYAAIKLELDKESLPPPLRPVAYLSSEWDLSSDWTLWPLDQ